MGKSKQGGVFGFIRGKVGSATYSVLPAKSSKSGKKEQIVRSLPESVSNPQTVGQVMQRMKLAPAQKFYAAFSELLSNAFQGVSYGEESRRYFLKKAMMEDGPYVQKGVDRFLPAEYMISEGSINSVTVLPFSSADSSQLHPGINIAAAIPANPTDINVALAAALGVDVNTQITVIAVYNVNGIFKPSYIGFDGRLRIADLPNASVVRVDDSTVLISPYELGIELEGRMVACAVVLSVKDASGAWLRSTQKLVISNEMKAQLYGADALQAAIYSYQSQTGAANSINSQWYYNLGSGQAYNGKLQVTYLTLTPFDEQLGEFMADTVVGLQQFDGRINRTIFADSLEDTGLIKIVEDGVITTNARATVAAARQALPDYNIELWQAGYATQLGF